MPPVTYVRHAMPVVEDGVHSSAWELDQSARAAASAMAERLEVGPGIGALVSSTEPKALQTAEAIAEHWSTVVIEDGRLCEAERPWIGAGYRALAHRYLRGEHPEGWEPHAQVIARMAASLHDAVARAERGPAVIVSHGLALCLHLGARLGDDFDRESFWSRLTFPDAWALAADDVLHRSPAREAIS